MKKHLLILLLLAAIMPLAANAQVPYLYTSYTATEGDGGNGDIGYPKLFDNDIETEWCVFFNFSSAYVEFNSATTIIPVGYVLSTSDAQNNPGRNPKSWTIKAKANIDDDWTTIVDETDNYTMYDVSFTDFTFNTGNTTEAYQYFRFEVLATQGANKLALTEFKFVVIDEPASCLTPYNLTYKDLEAFKVTLSWAQFGENSSWQLCLDGDEASLIDVTENPFTITGLTPATDHTAKLRANYGDQHSAWSNEISFTTRHAPVAIPYSTDFESSSCDWDFFNGDCTNRWCWGTAANHGGTHGIYISNDGGLTNAYDSYYYNISYAAISFELDNRDYVFSYDWRAQGVFYPYSAYGFLKVALVPASVTLEPIIDEYSFYYDVYDLPHGWIALYNGMEYNALYGAADWQSVNYKVTVPTAGLYNMVFLWYNNPRPTAYNPPAAIDNVSIRALPLRPTNLQYTTATGISATIHWTENGVATSWEICIDDDEDNLIEVNETTYTITDLPLDFPYTAKVRAIENGSLSEWSQPLRFMIPTGQTVIASDNMGWVYWLPFRCKSRYALNQQIYLASELGQAGNIQSIGYYMRNTRDSLTIIRNVDIYMAHTNLNCYETPNDYIPVTMANRVFSGTVTFTNNGWTTITLDTPFAYNGQSNLAITFDDNSGYINFDFGGGPTNEPVHFLSVYTDCATTLDDTYNTNISPFSVNPDASWRPFKNCIRVCFSDSKTHIANTVSETAMTWDEFVEAVNSGYTFQGKTVYLDEDVTATPMAGSNDDVTKCFQGTFDGQGHTITLDWTVTGQRRALFGSAKNATFKNLKVTGTINTNSKYAAGFLGRDWEGHCTFINCESNVTINATYNGEVYHGGFVGMGTQGTFTFEGCAFTGAFVGLNSRQWGGFVGQGGNANTYDNCLFAPNDNTECNAYGGNFECDDDNLNEATTFNNCYVTLSFFSSQGKLPREVSGVAPVTVELAGEATVHNVSHITAYSGTPGLIYNGTIIAGVGDTLALNLGGSDYYVANYGSLTGDANPYSLVMADHNTYISDMPSPPYSTDFETDCDWQLINGDRINQWCLGTAAHNGTGTHGLYISNDGGVTNAYTDGATAYANGQEYASFYTMVYAAKMFHFEEGAYNITFDWRALGYYDYDYMRVALVPASVSLEASAYLPAGFSDNTLPEGWLALDGGQKLNQSAEWQTLGSEFWVPASGNYNVVFAWRSNTWEANQPPAAIDNVSVTAITCSTPFNLVATNIDVTAADLNWNGSPDVDSYTLKYRTAEDIGAQFKEDFENESSFANWQAFGSSNTGNNFGRRTAAARTGSYGFSFSSRFQAAQYSQYLISPELSATGDLEFYFRASENNSREIFEIGYSSTGNNVDDFVWGQRYVSSYNSYWRHFQETIPEGTKYIAIHYIAQYQYELYIDDITIGAYEVQAGEWQTTTVEGGSLNTGVTLSGLTSGTKYEAQVKSNCHDPEEWTEPVTFRTVKPLYDTDFENDCDWTLVNGDCTNQWCWGTAAHNGGTHGLYISNDGGTTNAYNNGANMVFAYKTFDFEVGVYRFSYDWLAYGQNGYDFLRVALVPASVSLEAGDALPSGFSYNTLPGGWIALDGRSQLNRATEWQTESNDILISDAGSYMMVFAWRNDNSYKTNPPAAIDNVIIMQVTCPTPIDLAADNITYTTAELNWNSLTDMDGYLVRYRIDVSVNEGFENEDSFADWQAFGMDDANTGDGFGRSIYAAKNGLYGFSFTSVHETSDYNQYLISPQVSGNTDLEFYYRPYTSYSVETFRVGYSSTGNEVDDFVWGEEYSTSTSSNSWIRFHETIPGGTKYIAINYYSEYKGYLYIDDITIVNRGGEWQTATSATNSVTLTGLTLGTRYEVQVKSDCDEGKWSEAIFFATKPPVTKEIVGYGEGNANWYLIALPFAGETNPYMVDNIIGNTYDLYRFNPSHEDEEWENFENGFFWLVNGQGYLYANSEDVTFTFLAPDTDTETVEVPLAYDADDEHKCWNLVGNPFNCKAYLNKDYYILNDEGTGINPDAVSSSTPIPPCTAVFVKATSAEDKAVFMKHKYVDLGLPSGLLWATFNIGADTPEEYGDYFAWGETTPKNIYKWNNYKYCNGTYNTLTKYCGNSTYGYQGYSDNLTTLLPEDDAATANWGNDWRMPTDEEFEELYNNTTVIWTEQNGMIGSLFTAANGNSLFLPAVGYFSDSYLSGAGSYGYYWSSSLTYDSAQDFYISSDNTFVSSSIRCCGMNVRAVRSAAKH